MQLLKKRDFGELFNDTFGFVRENGKHFFSTYFRLILIPFAVMLVLIYFVTTRLYGLSGFDEDFGVMIEDYVRSHMGTSIVLGIVLFLLVIVFSIIQNSFTPTYLILYQKKGAEGFTATDVFNFIFKENIGKIILFIFASLIVSIPLIAIVAILTLLFLITIVGIFIPIAGFSLLMNMWFIDYLSSDKDVMESFSEAYSLLKQRFWAYILAVAVFILLMQLVSFGVNIITSTVTSLLTFNQLDADGKTLTAVLTLVFSFVILQFVNLIFQMIFNLMQNMVYFSAKEEKYNITGFDEIEQIGSGE